MTDTSLISIRYYLSLTEAQEGFQLASPKGHSTLIVQLLSVLIVLWGFWLGVPRGGLYFMILGGVFLVLQLMMQHVIIPRLFRRQYNQQRVASMQQGVDVDMVAQSITLFHTEDDTPQQQRFKLNDVSSVQKGKAIYLFSFNSGMLGIVPLRAVKEANQVELFERVFKVV
jgi:hypothetical protein